MKTPREIAHEASTCVTCAEYGAQELCDDCDEIIARAGMIEALKWARDLVEVDGLQLQDVDAKLAELEGAK
jgi:hypothetical protein